MAAPDRIQELVTEIDRAEGALERLWDALDDELAADEVRQRLAADTGERLSFEDLCKRAGQDPDEIRRSV